MWKVSIHRYRKNFNWHSSIVVGVPPVITYRQEDVVVRDNTLLDLRCDATGVPAPTIAWFIDEGPASAEFVTTDGRFVRTIRDSGSGASQAGSIYYCTATNSIGPDSLTATVRSRDIMVTYTCECNAFLVPIECVEPLNGSGLVPSISHPQVNCHCS